MPRSVSPALQGRGLTINLASCSHGVREVDHAGYESGQFDVAEVVGTPNRLPRRGRFTPQDTVIRLGLALELASANGYSPWGVTVWIEIQTNRGCIGCLN